MKKGIKRLLVTALTLVMALGMLAGCGSKGPTAEDAQAYVKAVLDLMCTGDYDHSVDLADVEEGKETEVRDNLVTAMVKEVSENAKLSEDVSAEFTQLILDAFGKAKYTVGDAVEADDGGYDVTVTMEPLRIFNVDQEEFLKDVEERVTADADKVAAMSQEEQTNYVMEILLEYMKKGLDDPKYDDPEEVVIHYGPLDDEGNYGCSKEEGEKLGAKLFSQAGLE